VFAVEPVPYRFRLNAFSELSAIVSAFACDVLSVP
jgi:hypothetical protein